MLDCKVKALFAKIQKSYKFFGIDSEILIRFLEYSLNVSLFQYFNFSILQTFHLTNLAIRFFEGLLSTTVFLGVV
jgi:hypothetical protein